MPNFSVVYFRKFLIPVKIPVKFIQKFPTQVGEDEERMVVMFAGVHLTAMFMVCTNPILYGFLNENFQQVHHA